MDFGRENGTKLAPKWDQKSMLTSKGRFYKSTYKTNRILMIFEVRGVEKSIKNQSKIDQKMKSPWEGLLDSIFLDFDGFGNPTWAQVGRENRAKTGQDRTRQGKTGQDKTRQRQRQDKTRQDKTLADRSAEG